MKIAETGTGQNNMLCISHTVPGGVEHELKRESWREWFIFIVGIHELECAKKMLGWTYHLYYKRKLYDRHADEYWLWIIAWVPLVAISWWSVARWCRIKGLLHNLPEPGARPHWFWPKYFLP